MVKQFAAVIFILIFTLFSCVEKKRIIDDETIKNPIANGADPWVYQKDGFYYYCYSGQGGICINKSEKLQEVVERNGKLIWKPDTGKAYSKQLWAPELFYLDNAWYVYVAASDGNNYNHRMFVLESNTNDAQGEYAFKGKISSPSDKWAIDGTVLEINSKKHFIWSGWEGDTNVQQNIYIAEMNNPWTITGKRVLLSEPEYDWEKIGNPFVNEGPQVLIKNNKAFVIYSASGSWTDSYCLGQLSLAGNNPMNPELWKKKNTPVFASTSTVFAPGHASFTKSQNGKEDWIVYHAAKHKGAKWNRNIRMQKFTWDIEGNPCFGYPVSEEIEITAPSTK